MALSSAEAKYMAASTASCEAIWLRKLIAELTSEMLEPTVVYCENQSGIGLYKNPVFHDRSKNIDIRYHFLRDNVQKGAIALEYVQTDQYVADILIKPLANRKFDMFRERLGFMSNTFLAKRECQILTMFSSDSVHHITRAYSVIRYNDRSEQQQQGCTYCRFVLQLFGLVSLHNRV